MLFALLSQLALAHTFPETQLTKVLGWTADGALVCEVSSHSIVTPDGDYIESAEDATDRYVVVLRDDKETNRWRVGSAYPSFVTSPPADQSDGWNAWAATHPLSAPANAPHGMTLAVSPRGKDGSYAMAKEGDGVRLTHQQVADESPIARVGLSNQGEGFWELWRAPFPYNHWTTEATITVRTSFSPDGSGVAILVQGADVNTMRGLVGGTLDVVLAPAAPLTAILAHESLPASAAESAELALAGLGALKVGTAKAARDASVVYYAEGFQAAASAMAARLPGGATVEPLTWKAPQHIVVALGATAAR